MFFRYSVLHHSLLWMVAERNRLQRIATSSVVLGYDLYPLLSYNLCFIQQYIPANIVILFLLYVLFQNLIFIYDMHFDNCYFCILVFKNKFFLSELSIYYTNLYLFFTSLIRCQIISPY